MNTPTYNTTYPVYNNPTKAAEYIHARGVVYYAEFDLSTPGRETVDLFRTDKWRLERIRAWTRSECAKYPKTAGLMAAKRLAELKLERATK